MAITCPRCGAGFDVTLFQFGHGVRCDCGAWGDLRGGHVLLCPAQSKEGVKMPEEEIGVVTHYFSKIGVAAIQLTKGNMAVGDTIRIKGHTSDFKQKVESVQLENASVPEGTVGQSVGIRVVDHARQHDLVYKVVA